MGNLCSRSANKPTASSTSTATDDPFARPGRTLSSANNPNPRAQIPKSATTTAAGGR
ncbi:MAG: hypothetical protein Q9210_006273, partial [Variospora velana]